MTDKRATLRRCKVCGGLLKEGDEGTSHPKGTGKCKDKRLPEPARKRRLNLQDRQWNKLEEIRQDRELPNRSAAAREVIDEVTNEGS